jgi:hypothetical protein
MPSHVTSAEPVRKSVTVPAERTAALGGTVNSSPVPAGGWRLSAELPQ